MTTTILFDDWNFNSKLTHKPAQKKTRPPQLMMNNSQKMTDIKVLVICDERGKDMKEFMLNIQDSMDTPKLVTYTFIICERKNPSMKRSVKLNQN